MNSRRVRLFPVAYKYACHRISRRGTADCSLSLSLSLVFFCDPYFLFFSHSLADRPLIESVRPSLLFQLREYTLTESYHEDDVEVEFVSNDNLQANSEAPRGIDPNRDLNEAIAEERREMDTQRYRYVSSLPKTPTFLTRPSLSLSPPASCPRKLFTSYFPRAPSGKEEVAFRDAPPRRPGSRMKKPPFPVYFITHLRIFDRIIGFIRTRLCRTSRP